MELYRQVILFLFVTCFSSSLYAHYSASQSPVGYWKTLDNETGQPKTIIQIWKTGDQQLAGKVVKIFNQQQHPMNGKVVLGLHGQENQWHQGELVDINNGQTYPCSVQLSENGKKLNVTQGFFYKQIWERVDLLSDA